jgi:excisionase family DNA binding protein
MAEIFLTVEQAAGRLQVKPFTLREWIKRGKIRAIRPGHAWRVPESAIAELAPPSTASNTNGSDLSRALAMVKARDARKPAKSVRKISAAEEISAMRDERLAELSHDE